MKNNNNFTTNKMSDNVSGAIASSDETGMNTKNENTENTGTVSASETSAREEKIKKHIEDLRSRKERRERIIREKVGEGYDINLFLSETSFDDTMDSLEKSVDDEETFAEVKKYLNYVCDTSRKKPVIPANLLVMGETESEAGAFVTDLLFAEHCRGKKLPKIERIKEADIKYLSGIKNKGNTETIFVIESMMTDAEIEVEEKKKNVPITDMWDKLSESLLGNKRNNKRIIVCASYDTAVERFYNSPVERFRNRLDTFWSFKIRLKEKNCDDVNAALLHEFEKSGFVADEEFKNGLADYNRAVYKTSSLPASDYIRQLFSTIVKNKYLQERAVKSLGLSDIPQYTAPVSSEDAARDIESLVGLSGVKKVLKELEGYLRMNEKEVGNMYLNFVFTGNPGTGKTTVARLMADMLFSMGIIKRNTVTEINGSELLGRYIGDEGRLVKQACRRAYGGILFIDEAYILDPSDASNNLKACREEVIANLMREMDMNRGKLCVIFAGYGKEMQEFTNANPGMRSRIFRTIEFEDFSEDEMLEIFRRECEREHCVFDEKVLEKAGEKLHIIKYDDNFGNARTVLNVLRDAQLASLEEDMAGGGKILKPGHIVIESKLPGLKESEEALERLTGLENVKNKIKEIVSMVRYNSVTGKNHIRAVSNMIFAGNPGTGKTTVARLFGNMLFALGAVKAPKFVSINAGDLNSLKIGGVTENLKKYCKEAMGGILFIDEAYAIGRFAPSATSDAVNVLLDMMENHRDELLIILAGYRNNMKYFLEENYGLSSRIPVTIDFEDYSEDEMVEIFKGFCEQSDFKVAPEAMTRFRSIIGGMSKNKDFANARSVRNIFENAYRRHAVRCVESGFAPSAAGDIITEEDMRDFDDMLNVREALGFK